MIQAEILEGVIKYQRREPRLKEPTLDSTSWSLPPLVFLLKIATESQANFYGTRKDVICQGYCNISL